MDDTFFASWMRVHFVVNLVVDTIFRSLGKEIIGELNGSAQCIFLPLTSHKKYDRFLQHSCS